VKLTKGGKGIIFGSEANKRIYMRSPLDVIQIGRLLGMQPDDAKNAISANCKSCF
jgi:RNase P/RNase MRP subunit p30